VYDSFAKVCKELVPIKDNLIDMAAQEPKPTKPLSDLWVLKQEFSGMNSQDKVQYLRQKMKGNNCDCYVLTALDEIAWLLNSILFLSKVLMIVRGNDMQCNPLFYSFLVLLPEEMFFFVEESRLNWPVHFLQITNFRLSHIQQHLLLFVIDYHTNHFTIFSNRTHRHLNDGGLTHEAQLPLYKL
jgi:hypothetical protein